MVTVTKRELILAVADAADIPQKKAKIAVATLIQAISDSLAAGDTVNLSPLGNFKTAAVKARTYSGFGKVTEVPAHNRVKFSPSQHLKNRLGMP